MTKFRVKLCTLLATVFVACVMCGVCMFTFADGASAAAVDENGWNTQVTRGDAKADVGHSVGDDGYSTFTDLQNGDKITFSEAVKIPFQDVFGSGKQLSIGHKRERYGQYQMGGLREKTRHGRPFYRRADLQRYDSRYVLGNHGDRRSVACRRGRREQRIQRKAGRGGSARLFHIR